MSFIFIVIMELIGGAVVCQKCSSILLRWNFCPKCQHKSSSSSPKNFLHCFSSKNIDKDEHLPEIPPPDKSYKPQKSDKVIPEKETLPRITERRIRIFNKKEYVDKDKSPKPNTEKRSLKLQLLLSSQEHYVYQSGSLSLSDSIIEEQWAESRLTSISLLRITSATFDNHPFLDNSYGKDITKLTFEGSCSFKALSRALETFPAVDTLEFSTGFFIWEDIDHEQESDDPRSEFTRIKSLSVNYDIERYDKMKETEQKQMILKIISLLNFFSGGLKALDYCRLSLPNTSEIGSHLNTFINANNSKGINWIDYTNNHIWLTLDSSPPEFLLNEPTPVTNNNRKRKAEAPQPEVEIIKTVSKEDKIQHVTLSDSDDEQESKEDDNGIMKGDDENVTALESDSSFANLPPPVSHCELCINSPQQVITLLSKTSWREAHIREWGSFYCKSMTIGIYEHYPKWEVMIFSESGMYFQFPHVTENEGALVKIGIPFQDITEVKVYPNLYSSKPTIFEKTNETSATWIREILGMSRSEESEAFYSPGSKYPGNRYIQFQTGKATRENRDLLMLMYGSKVLL